MKRYFLFLLGICALTLSSCRLLQRDYEMYVVNDTNEDCVVTWEFRGDHVMDGGWSEKIPFTVKAHSRENIVRHDSCSPSQLFKQFTVKTAAGETVYDASPVLDKDWQYEEQLYVDSKTETTMCTYTFYIK